MSEIFSGPWLQHAASCFDATLVEANQPTSVGLTILGGPDGDVPTVWTLDAQELTANVAPESEPTLVLTIPWPDAQAVIRGSLQPAVAYMQGKLKASGDMELLLRLLRSGESRAFIDWRSVLQSV